MLSQSINNDSYHTILNNNYTNKINSDFLIDRGNLIVKTKIRFSGI